MGDAMPPISRDEPVMKVGKYHRCVGRECKRGRRLVTISMWMHVDG